MIQLFRPTLLGQTMEEQMSQLVTYLYTLTEQLEFALDNIGTENLSPELLKQLNGLGANLEEAQSLNSQTEQRVGSLDLLTVSDVINSPAYKASIQAVKDETKTISGEGYVRFSDGTLICYGGMNGTSTTFGKSFNAVPIVLTTPSEDVTVTVSGITATDTKILSYMAIGKEAT